MLYFLSFFWLSTWRWNDWHTRVLLTPAIHSRDMGILWRKNSFDAFRRIQIDNVMMAMGMEALCSFKSGAWSFNIGSELNK